MIIQSLRDQLEQKLQSATEIYVAVALMNDFGLEMLIKANTSAKKKIIVGIDLPTSPKTLRKLFVLQTSNPNLLCAKVYYQKEVFHPKVYLMKDSSGTLTGFIGSANATNGGLFRNIEMSYFVGCPNECLELLRWFNNIFMKASSFDDEFIKKYELVYRRNKALASTQKSNNDKLKYLSIPIKGGNIAVNNGQFFRQSDFDAFAPANHFLTQEPVINHRRAVRDRLHELNALIYSRFNEFEITDLHLPAYQMNYTSYHWHVRGHNHIPMDAIWLNYGKNPQQLNVSRYRKFVENIRIQIILRNTNEEAFIGIWLFIGKKNGSYADRVHLKESLKNANFLAALYEYILELGGAYWIQIGNQHLGVLDITDKDVLYNFLITDNFSGFHMIGRNYQPNDPDLSVENIEETVLTEFYKLYKIYDLIRDR